MGYWDYDELMPVHYINISRDYADDIEAQAAKTGLQPFRTDLNVMMASSTNIQGQMEQVDTDLGYTWDSYTDPKMCIRDSTGREQADMGVKLLCGGRQNRLVDLMVTQNGKMCIRDSSMTAPTPPPASASPTPATSTAD